MGRGASLAATVVGAVVAESAKIVAAVLLIACEHPLASTGVAAAIELADEAAAEGEAAVAVGRAVVAAALALG